MSRPLRLIARIAGPLPLAFSLLVLGLWAASYFVWYSYEAYDGDFFRLRIAAGRIAWFHDTTYRMEREHFDGPWTEHHFRAAPGEGWGWDRGHARDFLGFGERHSAWSFGRGPLHWVAEHVVSLSPAALLAAVFPALRLGQRVRRAFRAEGGHCPGCGYDLHATPGRCPECGAVPPAKAN